MSEHAQERAHLRGISSEYINQVLRNPTGIWKNIQGRKKAMSVLKGRKLFVIYVETRTTFIIVTTFWER